MEIGAGESKRYGDTKGTAPGDIYVPRITSSDIVTTDTYTCTNTHTNAYELTQNNSHYSQHVELCRDIRVSNIRVNVHQLGGT